MSGIETGADVRLVVGLGNPGTKYVETRHNVGFMIVERIVRGMGGEFRKESRWKAEVSKPPGSGVFFLKPQTYMNLSGEAVRAAAGFYKIAAEQILVVYDDVALPFGQLRMRMKGSAGGHNGIRSMISCLGTDGFPRLKFGVETEGEDPRKALSDHVLGKFSPEERVELENYLDRAGDAVRYAVSSGLEAAMNQFNRKPERPKAKRVDGGAGESNAPDKI
ncbi:MAG: aminoacyl-tRNA hydrolase [Verrucomicrobiales bacterium]|nr:aminoacyl-tRNA hydrolase [Verrucomicrobiales bacterium]